MQRNLFGEDDLLKNSGIFVVDEEGRTTCHFRQFRSSWLIGAATGMHWICYELVKCVNARARTHYRKKNRKQTIIIEVINLPSNSNYLNLHVFIGPRIVAFIIHKPFTSYRVLQIKIMSFSFCRLGFFIFISIFLFFTSYFSRLYV